jgi:riboflavin biosynthesis pyrimidine reductase
MKPHVIMHMMQSLDGRITMDHWPDDKSMYDAVYEQLHGELKGDAWIVGRTTMAEFGKGEAKPVTTSEVFPRETWKAPDLGPGPYAIALDRSGKLHINISRANDDAIIVVLSSDASDAHLAELRRDGISYIFAGQDEELDLDQALETLAAEFGIKRLLLEGGGGINGSFLTAGLIDEISVLLLPLADGSSGPKLFDRDDAPACKLELLGVDNLEGDVLHLRYAVVSE